MNIAIINKETNICENVAVFENLQTATEMFSETKIVTEQEGQYWIGDIYKDGIWSKAERPQPTPSEQREHAYETLTHKEDGTILIEWEGQAITVNKASEKWLYYSSEGSGIANEISGLIVEAKSYIRGLYSESEV